MTKRNLRTTIFILFSFAKITFTIAQINKKITWDFPLPRTHTGILLGNGTQGLMVWGKDNLLNITIGRAGFWDHRGGNDFSVRVNYNGLKKLLQNNQQDSIKHAFEVPKLPNANPSFGQPRQIGGGRLEIELPKGWTLTKGELNLSKAEIQISATFQGRIQIITIRQAIIDELFWVTIPAGLTATKISLKSAWDFISEDLAKAGIEKPIIWLCPENNCGGFTQRLPEDVPLSIGYSRKGNTVSVATSLRYDSREIVEHKLQNNDYQRAIPLIESWWKNYWENIPKVSLPDPILQELYDYGLYKQACSTPPQGIACTLQGPFIEEYQLAPWSNDYHFNINAEMIYYPALMSGKFDHFKPLWNMIESWKTQISKNGETFFGRKGAMMLPHAVDDKCKVVGSFWTGTIDHACTAWMAQMAWLHFSYSGDKSILEKTAYPLLNGTFEGYWAMLEEKNGIFHLPISVSPEYGGNSFDAWGDNASFQLAALHAICKILPKAANILKMPIDPRWKEVDTKLPDYSLINKNIALWEGMELKEAHRHHSHLSSIYPFVSIDPNAETNKNIVQNAVNTWVEKGTGTWAGWSFPWAAIIHARTGQTEAAVSWLHYWKENFTNEGRGTLSNANTNGHSVFGQPVWSKLPENTPNREIMQLDAGFGALSAIYELLVQNRIDGIYVLPDMPFYWKSLFFQDIWTEGGFKISAKVELGKVVEVKIKSTREGNINLYHNLGEKYTINNAPKTGKFFEKKMKSGDEIVLIRAN
ncbi:hypothetical protein EMA8858_01503 [Emticicia aquatica]|uniref:Glycosyl hydrolase family 95 catalytic domain-containing protein n=1 Tax=Emticicia aquatica TaxID=1681835 RepID=A0ABM9ANP1_9BACT|nr:hypothetical protein [Emticicia aquatica]CAH0995382.1 hypothetical protein EMA8858_01503 [Emticicia aquatica]